MCKLTMLGTGNALVTKCFNSCFVVSSATTHLLVDAGGGNGILAQLEKAGIDVGSLDGLYLTHAHEDHLLGAVWIIRMMATLMKKGKRTEKFPIYGNSHVIKALYGICRYALAPANFEYVCERIPLVEMSEADSVMVGDFRLRPFDIHSTKLTQFGVEITLPGGKRLVCLGDEPYNEANRSVVEGVDWLICEAFCLYSQREQFKPYEKHHSTALDAGRAAESLGVRNLIIYHTEDTQLADRKRLYGAEAASAYSGNVYVPDDLEVIEL